MNALVEAPANSGLPIDATTLENWTAQGHALFSQHRETMWSIAAWMEAGAMQFGDDAQRIALEIFGKSCAELRRIMDTSKRFPPEKRRPELTFGHHSLVLKVSDDRADQILDEAAKNQFSLSRTKKIVAEIRESEGGDIFQQMASISHEELVDDWTGKMIRLFNCAPSQEAQDQFFELSETRKAGLIMQ